MSPALGRLCAVGDYSVAKRAPGNSRSEALTYVAAHSHGNFAFESDRGSTRTKRVALVAAEFNRKRAARGQLSSAVRKTRLPAAAIAGLLAFPVECCPQCGTFKPCILSKSPAQIPRRRYAATKCSDADSRGRERGDGTTQEVRRSRWLGHRHPLCLVPDFEDSSRSLGLPCCCRGRRHRRPLDEQIEEGEHGRPAQASSAYPHPSTARSVQAPARSSSSSGARASASRAGRACSVVDAHPTNGSYYSSSHPAAGERAHGWCPRGTTTGQCRSQRDPRAESPPDVGTHRLCPATR